MIIDIHTHLFAASVCKDRAAYFPGEPAFELLYQSEKAKMVGPEEIIAAMDQGGVDVSVVCGFPWRSQETAKLGNDAVLEAVSRYPERLKGFCCVDPTAAGAAAEVERCLDAGMVGVGELAFYQSGIEAALLQRMEPVMALCAERDVPVMIHTNEPVGHAYPGKTPNTLAQIYSIPKTFPRNKIILAHWGGGLLFFVLLKKEVRGVLEKVFFDTAASPFLYEPAVYQMAVSLGLEDKILFGSDYPLIAPARYFKEFEKAGLSETVVRKIGGQNAAGLLHL